MLRYGKHVIVIILPTDQTTYEDKEALADKCVIHAPCGISLEGTPGFSIKKILLPTLFSLPVLGQSTMTMETEKPLKENCLTNKKVLGDAFIGRRELNLKRL